MTAKKKPVTKFTGELADPILAPLSTGVDLIADSVLVARARKLGLLAEHYGVDSNDWFSLACKMACDLVPGFQVLYDDPWARAIQTDPVMGPAVADLPVYYGNGTKPKGSGSIPEWLDGELLVGLFNLLKREFPKEKDSSLADKLVLCLDVSLAGRAHEKERFARSKTICNRLSKARNALV